MADLSISCMGSFQITLRGVPLSIPGTPKIRALLAYLAVERDKIHSRESLAGLLWSDQPESNALHNLRQALSILRKVLGDDTYLLITPEGVQFNPAQNIWLDVFEFQKQISSALAHYGLCAQSGGLNVRRLRRAVDLYRGPFMDQLSLSGSQLFEEWLTLQREELVRQMAEVLTRLAEYHERRGEYSQAAQVNARLVKMMPWEEDIHAGLIRLLALDGQWAAARAQYTACCRYLDEQLGVSPSASTTVLYEAVRQAARQPGKPLPAVLQPKYPPARHNLSPAPTSFVGRAAELDAIAEKIAHPDCRMLTLLGPGGIGKSRLALEAAREQVGVFTDGVFQISLVSVDNSEHLLTAIASAIGLSFSESGKQQTQLLDFLRQKYLLLVLDNFEQLLQDERSTRILDEILKQAARVFLLITSRERLNLQEECVFPVQGMAYPEDGEFPLFPQGFDALELFLHRVRQVHGEFTPDAEAQSAIIQICRLLDGLPLGMELAAAATWQYTCPQIVTQITHHLESLTASASNISPRHRSLWAAFDVSWSLLIPLEQAVFSRLSVFRGGFTEPFAQQIAQADAKVLSALVDQSLLRRDITGRYEMHAAIRQYAADKLSDTPEQVFETRKTHALVYADFLYEKNAAIKGAEQVQALELIHLESSNTRTAWEWLVENEYIAELLRSMDSFYQYYNIRSQFAEGIRLFQFAVRKLEKMENAGLALGMCLSRLGGLAYRARDNALTQESLERARGLLNPLDVPEETAFLLITLGAWYHRKKNFPPALECGEESLRLYRQLHNDWGESYALYLLGLIKDRQAKFEEARELLEWSVKICRKTGNEQRLIAPLNILGDIACVFQDYVSAEKYFNEGLEISRKLNDRYHSGILLNNLATIYQARQQYEREQAVLEESIAICREIGDRDGEAISLNALGEMAVHRGEYLRAVEFSQRALQIALVVEEDWTTIVCLYNLGEAQGELADISTAEKNITQGLQKAIAIDSPGLMAHGIILLGRMAQIQEKKERASAYFKAALAHSSVEDEARNRAIQWLAWMGDQELPEPNDQIMEALVEQLKQTWNMDFSEN